jgi:hypothetical protein
MRHPVDSATLRHRHHEPDHQQRQHDHTSGAIRRLRPSGEASLGGGEWVVFLSVVWTS